MKLLLSCYECSPIRGSECGIGWHWAYEARRMGHEVWCLVAPTYEGEIRGACKADPIAASIHWIFPQSPFWRLADGYRPKAERRHNLLWQFAALKEARQLAKTVRFDIVHQVTWGGLRVPSFLWKLPVPFIVGPVGGGETSPSGLRDAFSMRNRMTERVRDLSNATLMLNPPIHRMLNAAKIIVARTTESRDILPKRLRRKTVVELGIGVTEQRIGQPRRRTVAAPRILFAGRLLYWKGIHLALGAFDRLSRQMPDAQFTIVGSGPETAELLRKIEDDPYLAERVTVKGWMEQEDIFGLYHTYDLFLFPSLHDSGGMVVLEALASGLPVVCLDLGGPNELVDKTCGVAVKTAGLNSPRVVEALASAAANILIDEERWEALSKGAIGRARQFTWSRRVSNFYTSIEPGIAQARSGPFPAASVAPILSDTISANERACAKT
ncbi:MAG: glycosyltransferase family 4 protein [Aliidongia sp.]